MTLLNTLRNAPWLARLALLWFALTLTAAVASPMVQPRHELVICTGAGMLKVALADDGTVTTAALPDSGGTLFCPLCLAGSASRPFSLDTLAPSQPLGRVLQSVPAASIAALTAAPPPARAPPKV